MNRKVLEYVQKNNMLSSGDRVVAGVSGGADSMCLLSLLLSWREMLDLRILVVHINHGIRGAEAKRDEQFVEHFCRERGVEFVCITGNIPDMAAEQGLTEEEAGRRFRYEQFLQICRQRDFNRIAVAHNRDDNAETILFNLFRGSGISGIRGIAPVRANGVVTVVRPLLCVSRQEIEEYLSKERIGFCTDSTNLELEYSRNRIRNVIIPIVRDSINSQAVAHVALLGEQAGRIEDYLREVCDCEMTSMAEHGQLCRIRSEENNRLLAAELDIEHLTGLHEVIRTSIIRRIIGELANSMKDIENRHIEAVTDIAGGETGRGIDLPYGLRVEKEYSRVVIRCRASGTEEAGIQCEIPGEYTLGDGRRLKLYSFACEKMPIIPKNNYTKYYDYDKIIGSIELRTRRNGDYLLIGDGKGGLRKKTLKTWLIDNKVSRTERGRMPLLTVGDHVLWIIGNRGDDSYPVTEFTKRVLAAELLTEQF